MSNPVAGPTTGMSIAALVVLVPGSRTVGRLVLVPEPAMADSVILNMVKFSKAC